MSIREEFYKWFLDETLLTGAHPTNNEVSDWWIATLTKKIEGMRKSTIAEKHGELPSRNEERVLDQNEALDSIITMLNE